MKTSLLCFITKISVIVCLSFLAVPVLGEDAPPVQLTPLKNGDKILFLGNSYSGFCGPLRDEVVALIKASNTNINITVGEAGKGMGILKEYVMWKSLDVLNKIRTGGYTHVVIQGWEDAMNLKDMEWTENNELYPDAVRITDRSGYPACQDTMLKYLKILDEEVKKAGAKTILFEPHVSANNWVADFPKSAETYAKLKKEVSVFHAPVIKAWDSLRILYPPTRYECAPGTGFIKMLYGDCGHQNFDGAALDGMVFYSMLTRQSAEGLKPELPHKMRLPERYDEFAAIAYAVAKDILKMNNSWIDDTQAPSTPSNLKSAEVMADGVSLTWTGSTDNLGVLGYNIYCDGVLVARSPLPKFTLGGFYSSSTYSITVTAYDSEKNESEPCAALEVKTKDFEEVDSEGTLLMWDFNSANGVPRYMASTVAAGISKVPPVSGEVHIGPVLTVSTDNANMLNISKQQQTTLARAISGMEYFSFTIAPQDGNSITLNTIALLPRSRSNLNRNFTLMSSITGFAEGNAIETFNCSSDSNTNTETITLTGHENITEPVEFRFYVWGNDNQWSSFYIDDLKITGSVKTLPMETRPTELTVAGLTEDGFLLKWRGAKNARSYEVFKDGVSVGTTTKREISITGTIGSTYVMTVKATDNDEAVSQASEAKSVTIPDLTAPSVPQNLKAHNIKPDSFGLSWDASNDNIGIDFYEVYLDDVLYESTDETSLLIEGVQENTTYKVKVKAVDLFGNESEFSETLSVAIPDFTAPSVPQNLKAENITSDSFNLSWDASGDNAGVDFYEVYLDGAIYAESVETTSIFINELSENTTYKASVKAVDLSGNESDLSQSIDVTTYAIGAEDANTEEVHIYPNPAKNVFVVMCDSETCRVTLFSLSGKRIAVFNNVANGSAIDISAYPRGSYIVKINTLKKSYKLPLVVE